MKNKDISADKKMERPLTTREIEDILSFLHCNSLIPKETANSIIDVTRKDFGKMLKNIKISPKNIPILKDALKSIYYDSLIAPGEAVGIIAGQSICERQTQGNLNTFHKAGSGDKQSSTSKFSEFLNGTDNPKNPGYFIRLKYGNDTLENVRKTIGSDLREFTVKRITKKHTFFTEEKTESWYEGWCLLNDLEFDNRCGLSLEIDMEQLYEYRLTLIDVAKFLMKKCIDHVCIPSPDNFGRIDIFPDISEVEFDSSLVLEDENETEVYLREILKPTIDNTIICGIPGVKNIYFLKDTTTSSQLNSESKASSRPSGSSGPLSPPLNAPSWMIETENSKIKPQEVIKGRKKSNKKIKDTVTTFKKMLALPFVDMSRSYSNNIWDIYNTFGIEAVREYLIVEMEKIMEGINLCHILLLVDKMTFSGSIASISRYSTRKEPSVIARSSFEETMDNYLQAGVYCQEEEATGNSAAILFGQRGIFGTGAVDISFNIEKLMNS